MLLLQEVIGCSPTARKKESGEERAYFITRAWGYTATPRSTGTPSAPPSNPRILGTRPPTSRHPAVARGVGILGIDANETFTGGGGCRATGTLPEARKCCTTPRFGGCTCRPRGSSPSKGGVHECRHQAASDHGAPPPRRSTATRPQLARIPGGEPPIESRRLAREHRKPAPHNPKGRL